MLLRINCLELYQKIIIAGGFVVGALVVGIRGCAKDMGEEIYRGNINGQEIVYEEGVQAIFDRNEDNFVKNRMVVKTGEMTYILEDRKDETDIDWKKQQKPNFEKDNLEKVVIQNGDNSQVYWGKFDTSTIQGQKAKEVFDKADLLYNSLREKIREELRNRYEAEQKPFVDSFQK